MDYETALETCSNEVQAAIKWLEEQVKFDRETLEKRLEKEKESYREKDISRRLTVKYFCSDALEFYVLHKVKSPLLKDFLDASKSEEFWLERDENEEFLFDGYLSDYPHLLWYLSKMGLNSNEYFEKAVNMLIKEKQTVKGEIYSPSFSHTGSMRVLVAVEPESETTDMAVRYFLNSLDEFKKPFRLKELAIGMLALSEFDYLMYKETMEDIANYLKIKQEKEGYWGDILEGERQFVETSLVTEALSRFLGQNNESVLKATEWLKRNREEDGSWKSMWDGTCTIFDEEWAIYWAYPTNTAYACLALISAGEGPKASLEDVEWREMLRRQELKYIKPYFVHTSPKYFEEYHVEDIQKIIRRMLHSAKSEIKILSPHFELLHDELIKLITEKTNLSFKVITRPKGEQAKHNQKIIDLLNKYTKGNCKSHWKLHSRMVIIDKNEVLISSSDLDRNGLIDQYNAGLWTRDKEAVEDAIKFFENIWTESEGKTQITEEKES